MQHGEQADDRFMRRGEVEKMVGLSTSAIYQHMGDGIFPKPIRVGKAAVRWRLSAIRDWMAKQEAV